MALCQERLLVQLHGRSRRPLATQRHGRREAHELPETSWISWLCFASLLLLCVCEVLIGDWSKQIIESSGRGLPHACHQRDDRDQYCRGGRRRARLQCHHSLQSNTQLWLLHSVQSKQQQKKQTKNNFKQTEISKYFRNQGRARSAKSFYYVLQDAEQANESNDDLKNFIEIEEVPSTFLLSLF